jgi:two-component system chemotaxis sensor kinase CheA
LDVVRSNIQKIGGSIEIHSEAGRGTRFILQVPLSTSED